jgi:hypothetical protein
MFDNIRSQAITAIEKAGGSTADATIFMGTLGNGTLLQMILSFFGNLQGLEGFITFLVSLFTSFSGTQSAAAIVAKSKATPYPEEFPSTVPPALKP